MQDVLVFGASGYSGLELLRVLNRHPARVVGVSSSKWRGEPVRDRVPEWSEGLAFRDHDALLADARAGQFAFLATPADVSLELAPTLLEKGLRVLDLSGAFRLESSQDYQSWYGFSHPREDLLAEAHYGLFEWFPIRDPDQIRLVAVPGCYATAAALAVAPLLMHGAMDPARPIMMDGKSGTTGAGRKADERLSFSEVAENLRPYRVGKHQHTPEIERTLGRLLRGHSPRVSFAAHLVPMRRGLIVSAYGSATEGATGTVIESAYARAYEHSCFVRPLKEPPETLPVRGSNFATVFAVLDERTRTISAFAAIDNLVKGAAGQAVQNLNALLRLPEDTGLRGFIREGL
jgi:N-acetyl-gamma-glutamyl-phosphate reductase